jgi:hypothetical protein
VLIRVGDGYLTSSLEQRLVAWSYPKQNIEVHRLKLIQISNHKLYCTGRLLLLLLLHHGMWHFHLVALLTYTNQSSTAQLQTSKSIIPYIFIKKLFHVHMNDFPAYQCRSWLPHVTRDLQACNSPLPPPPLAPKTSFLLIKWLYIYKRGFSVLPDFYSHMRSYYFRYTNTYIIEEEEEEQPEPGSSRVSW